jgi:glycosyltransferase involved in cell wall biosynthesis
MRVKIIEGMAMGKAIIATPIGAEGIAHTDGKNILLARTIPEFTDAIVALHDDPERARRMGHEARKLVLAKYANERIVRDLVAFYKRLLKG